MKNVSIDEVVNHHTGKPAWQFSYDDDEGKRHKSAYMESEKDAQDWVDQNDRNQVIEDLLKPFIYKEVKEDGQSDKYFDNMWLFFWGIMGTDIKNGIIKAIFSLKNKENEHLFPKIEK